MKNRYCLLLFIAMISASLGAMDQGARDAIAAIQARRTACITQVMLTPRSKQVVQEYALAQIPKTMPCGLPISVSVNKVTHTISDPAEIYQVLLSLPGKQYDTQPLKPAGSPAPVPGGCEIKSIKTAKYEVTLKFDKQNAMGEFTTMINSDTFARLHIKP